MVKQGFVVALFLSAAAGPAAGQELTEAVFLGELPTVLTASRIAQPLMDTPNSTTVIDRRMIEASGYHSLADLFRLVPGMFVGYSRGWSPSVSHTFADEFSRRLQVLVDGRSVYQATTGGVDWESLPLAVDDIERIEVVRGPNAASFGANATTGVINIITRHPDDVAGRMLHLINGDHGRREDWFRWAGGGEGASQRITLGHREDDGFSNLNDSQQSDMFSYRGDFDLANRKALSVQAGYLDGSRGQGNLSDAASQPHDQDVTSYFMQADYRQNLSDDRELLVKAYFNHLFLDEKVPVMSLPPVVPAGSYYMRDLLGERWHGEFQVNTQHGQGLRSSLGGYVRRDEVRSVYYWNTPDTLQADSWGVFGHAEWRFQPQWLLNAGAFYEDYGKVGGKFSPRMTLHWQPSPHHSLRLGVSKAYRNPVLYETDADTRLNLLASDGSPLLTLPLSTSYILASGDLQPERLVSREIGYLGQWPEQGLTLDLRLFREHLSNYISLECTGTSASCKGINPTSPRSYVTQSGSDQEGVEAQLKWQPSRNTLVLANYAVLSIDSHNDEKRYSPSHMSGLHLMHRFPREVDMTLSQYWVSAFEPIGLAPLPGYHRLDARIAKGFKLDGMHGVVALTWQNLGGSYIEFDARNGNIFDERAFLSLQLDF